MKLRIHMHILILVSFILTGCSSSDSPPPSTPGTQQITGFYYSFDESGSIIVDSSGNNYDGSPSSISRVPGKVGNAVQFLGSGSTIDLDIINNYFPYSSGLTFMAWIKTDSAITTNQQLIGGMTGSDAAAIVSNFGISLVDDRISFEIPAQQNVLSITTGQLSFPLDTWFHIAITYDNDTISFYYNGNLVHTDSILTTYSSYFQNQIGNNLRIFGGIQIEDQFVGYIDELYLENKVSTPSEIATYYTSTL